MKASNYNYIIHKDDRSYWYNGVSKKYFRLSYELGIKLETLLNNKCFSTLTPNLINKLKDHGFIIPKETDEIELIRNRFKVEIEKKDYFLVILPTLNCNFNCWYCIQDHIPSMMSESTRNSLVQHIKHMIEVENITSLHIEWFGGEPFMGFKNIILPISNIARDLCRDANIPFVNTATTNGFFITEDKYQDLANIKMTGFQITLDGERDNHNNVKYLANDILKKVSAFDITLQNIAGYLRFNPEASLKLRINYTHDNLTNNIITQISGFFPKDIQNRVHIILKKVWQEKTDKDFYSHTLDLQSDFIKNGFSVNILDIVYDFVPCYANRRYYTAVNFNGDLLKCTASNDLYAEEPLVMINADGSLSWKDGIETAYSSSSFENEKCLDCKYLPICMGNCPRNHIAHATSCKFDNLDINIDEGIINLIDESYESFLP